MKFFRPMMIGTLTSIVLAGCQSPNLNSGSPQVAVAPPPTATQPVTINIDGKWVPADPANRSVYYNEFRNGKFGAYSADGSSTLAVGTYARTADGVQFKYYSPSRKKNVTADCKLFGTDKLQCTVDGSIVDLQRA